MTADTGKTAMDYRCPWCKYEFTKLVGKYLASNTGREKRGSISDQVCCPRCGGGLKTWG